MPVRRTEVPLWRVLAGDCWHPSGVDAWHSTNHPFVS